MSVVGPFEGDKSLIERNEDYDAAVFKPDLSDVNWAAQEARQEQLDALLDAGGERLAELINKLHDEDSEVGVKLNNLHNTTIEGELPRGLGAQLAVMTRTAVRTALPGFDFKGGVAPEVDFSQQRLVGANFLESVLPRANFGGADLTGADFTNVVLNGANFRGAKVGGADFTGAYLVGIEGLDEEQIRTGNFRAARADIHPTGEPTELQQLISSHFGEPGDLQAILKLITPVPIYINPEMGAAVSLLQSKRLLRGLFAQNANWTRAEFTDSIMTGLTVDGLAANQASFRAAWMGGGIVRRAIMREVDMVSTWAPGIIIEETDMRDANVTGANLVGAVLRGVDLRGAVGLNSTETNLNGVYVEDCRLPQGYGFNGREIEASEKKKRELEDGSDDD